MKKTKSQKQLQIGENYKREMSQIFMQDDMLNFKNCHITILEADVSPDLKNIKFYLDIFGEESFQIKEILRLCLPLNEVTLIFLLKLDRSVYFCLLAPCFQQKSV